MENASKALIIVGEVLIAIIILSILAAVIVSFGRYSSNMHKKISDQEIYQFNENFLNYSGRVNITAQEIATIINFAKKENDKNDLSRTNSENNESYIDVLIDNKSFFKNIITNDEDYKDNIKFSNKVNQFIKSNNIYYYRCQGNFETPIKIVDGVKEIYTKEDTVVDIEYNSFKKVKSIRFHQIKPNSDNKKTYNVTEPIVVNPDKK